MLTQDQVDYFHANGFLIIKDFADPKILLNKTQELVDNAQDSNCIFKTGDDDHVGDEYFLNSGDKIRYFYEEKAFKNSELITRKQDSINKIGHGLHLKQDVFKEFSTGKEIQDIALKLGFRDPRILQSMLIFKNARIGGEVPAHQDSTFIYTNPDSTVGFWYTLQDATEENGCMEFWPGSHSLEISKRMIRSSTKGTEFQYTSSEPEIKDSNFIKHPTKAGTLVIIHGNVYHKTAGNTSDKSRWIYAWHMIEGEYEYPSSNWLQTEQEFTKLLSQDKTFTKSELE